MKKYDLNSLESLATLWVAADGLPQQLEFEEKLRPLIETNKRFSREYLFEQNIINGRILSIFFIPTSEAYKKYGESVTIMKFVEIEEIRRNFNLKNNTNGFVKALGFLNIGTEKEDIEIIFQTRDILSIEHR